MSLENIHHDLLKNMSTPQQYINNNISQEFINCMLEFKNYIVFGGQKLTILDTDTNKIIKNVELSNSIDTELDLNLAIDEDEVIKTMCVNNDHSYLFIATNMNLYKFSMNTFKFVDIWYYLTEINTINKIICCNNNRLICVVENKYFYIFDQDTLTYSYIYSIIMNTSKYPLSILAVDNILYIGHYDTLRIYDMNTRMFTLPYFYGDEPDPDSHIVDMCYIGNYNIICSTNKNFLLEWSLEEDGFKEIYADDTCNVMNAKLYVTDDIIFINSNTSILLLSSHDLTNILYTFNFSNNNYLLSTSIYSKNSKKLYYFLDKLYSYDFKQAYLSYFTNKNYLRNREIGKLKNYYFN